jgi:hypothetical protein
MEKYMQLSPFEVSELIKEDPVSAAIARSKGPNGTLVGNEYCNTCGCDMGYSIHIHSEDPIRFKNDSLFRDGVGETCGACFTKEGILKQ